MGIWERKDRIGWVGSAGGVRRADVRVYKFEE